MREGAIELNTLEIDLGGGNHQDFGIVRPPGSNPGTPTKHLLFEELAK